MHYPNILSEYSYTDILLYFAQIYILHGWFYYDFNVDTSFSTE